jgi:hypothetical protein
MGDAVSEKARYLVTDNHGGEPTVLLLQRERCEPIGRVELSWNCRDGQRIRREFRRRARRLVRRLIRRALSLFLVSARSVS